MSDTTHTTPELELQVLTAQDGTAYLLPRALVEAARLTPEAAAALAEAAASDDVHGLYFSLADQYAADRARADAENKQLAAAHQMSLDLQAFQLAAIAHVADVTRILKQNNYLLPARWS